MNGDVRLAAYAPADGGVNDHCIVRAADGWHYFFIYRRYDLWDGVGTTAGSTIGHAHSPDLVAWRTCADALQPDADAGAWDGAHVWAPHVVRRGRYWYMAYAGVDRHGIQRLGIVRSADLHDWERFTDGPVLDAARFPWFDRNAPHAHFYDCRDPFLLEHGDGYLMYYTARADDDVPCIAAAASDDLLHWQDRGPVLRMVHYQPDGQQRTPLESCCVFARDGLWYLVYQLRGIRYHISRDPLEWHGTPPRYVQHHEVAVPLGRPRAEPPYLQNPLLLRGAALGPGALGGRAHAAGPLPPGCFRGVRRASSVVGRPSAYQMPWPARLLERWLAISTRASPTTEYTSSSAVAVEYCPWISPSRST